MKVGDLVRVVSGGTVGMIVALEEFYLMAKKTPFAVLDSGEKYHLHQLEVINESR